MLSLPIYISKTSRTHFQKKNFKNNREETHLLVARSGPQDRYVRCSETFETCSQTLLTLGHDHNKGIWSIVCSIDGLVLLKRLTVPIKFRDLKVWNPSIRKIHEFPSLPEIEIYTSPYSDFTDADIGLGYDLLANDYKHVKLIFEDKILHSVAVYSLGTGSWKITPFQGKGCSWHWAMGMGSIEWKRNVYLRGSLYFIAWDVEQGVWDLVSFDLSSEVFSSIRRPDNEGSSHWSELTLIDGGCSLAVFGRSSLDNFISLWALESANEGSESMCWIKRYSFCWEYTEFLHLKKNGDMLTQKYCNGTLTGEAGEQSVVWCRVTSYNPETEEHKIVEERRDSFYYINHVCAYIESLNLLK